MSAAFIYLFVSQYKHTLIDDSYINLGYVKNLLSTQTWGMLKGNISNTATSPLNVIMLSIVALFTGANELAVIISTATLLFFITYLLSSLSEQLFHTRCYGLIASVFIVFNPLLLSTIGMESILFSFLFILCLAAYVQKKFLMLGVAAGLLTITRADGGLFFIIYLIFSDGYKNRLQLTRSFLLCAVPWYAVSWVYLGSIVPDSLFIKMGLGSWGKWTFANGPFLYIQKYPIEVAVTLCSLLLLPFIFQKHVYKQPVIKILLTSLVAHFCAYSLLHVPPFHWYYTSEIIAFSLAGIFGLGFHMTHLNMNRGMLTPKVPLVLTGLISLLPCVGMGYLFYQNSWTLKQAHIHTNWATTDQYKSIAETIADLTKSEVSVQLHNVEIGALAYFSGDFLLDPFSDRKQLIERMFSEAKSKSPLFRKFLLFNYYFLDVQTDFPNAHYALTAEENPPGSSELLRQWYLSSKWLPGKKLMLYKLAQSIPH